MIKDRGQIWATWNPTPLLHLWSKQDSPLCRYTAVTQIQLLPQYKNSGVNSKEKRQNHDNVFSMQWEECPFPNISMKCWGLTTPGMTAVGQPQHLPTRQSYLLRVATSLGTVLLLVVTHQLGCVVSIWQLSVGFAETEGLTTAHCLAVLQRIVDQALKHSLNFIPVWLLNIWNTLPCLVHTFFCITKL